MPFIEPTAEERDFLLHVYPALSQDFFEKCSIYGEYLYKTNETMNLTRIPPESFWSKHVCDSLSLLRVPGDLAPKRLKVCDTGCGAGLPSLILAAALPAWQVTAVDSTGKKIEFVRRAAAEMQLRNLTAIHARANELARKAPYKHGFDLVTARAVADAPVLLRETGNFLKRSGILAIYRTMQQAGPELELLKKAKFQVLPTEEFDLPHDAGRRMFLLISGLAE